MINSERLANRFKTMCGIDSLSRDERNLALMIEEILRSLGAKVCYDSAKEKTNGNCSNLIAVFKGTADVEPLFLSGHMDTVGPGQGVKVCYEDGIFKSDGTTILGSDDKSAIAIILEVMEVIKENKIDCPPVEIIFTVCEEIGLLGAKYLDYRLINSKFGYILDSTDTEGVVTRSPAANKITVKIYGKAAHAGAEPEKGINAIQIASTAISKLQLGRIDYETTCNIGTFKGGVATNVVPEFVEIHGEVRSHDLRKLNAVTQDIITIFNETVEKFKTKDSNPKIEIQIDDDFPPTQIPEDHQVIRLVKKAAGHLGITLSCKTIGGGSDANIFFSKGIMAGVLGTGMSDVHTLNENIHIRDMEDCANLVLEILKTHAAGES